MKKYYLIDLSERDAREELKEYRFEELKAYFEPDKEELKEEWEEWQKVKDILDLESFLEWQAQGDAVHYNFEEVEN